MSDVLFQHEYEGVGTLAVIALDPDGDAELLHRWVTHPKAVYWLMSDDSLDEVRAAYREIAEHPHHEAYIGLLDGEPAFLIERYDPAEVELKGMYEAEPGDKGMHFLTAPSDARIPGFTRAVITTVMAFVLSDPAVRRVVVEPDVHNSAVHALNKAVGFEADREIEKPEKRALLSFCTREQFTEATGVRP